MEKRTANIGDSCDRCCKDIDAGSKYYSCSKDFYWVCLECGEDKSLLKKYDTFDPNKMFVKELQSARVIITLACSRTCSYCCNTHAGVVRGGQTIKSLADIPHRDILCISGGEPVEHMELLKRVVADAKNLRFKKIYLYTALYSQKLYDVLPHLDGVNFTLHEKATEKDTDGFECLQYMALDNPKKSFRAWIHPDQTNTIRVRPQVWARFEIKPHIDEGTTCLPEHETLYILRS
jgi:hypothetical protein